MIYNNFCVFKCKLAVLAIVTWNGSESNDYFLKLALKSTMLLLMRYFTNKCDGVQQSMVEF